MIEQNDRNLKLEEFKLFSVSWYDYIISDLTLSMMFVFVVFVCLLYETDDDDDDND